MKSGLMLLVLGLLVLAITPPARSETAGSQSASSLVPPDVQDLVFLGPVRPLLLRLHVTIDGKPFRQAWQERFDELFALEDRDGDGRVTLDEAAAIVRDMNGGLRDAPQADVKVLAASGGTVDRAALVAHIETTLPPFSVRRRAVIVRDSAAALFPLLDTDRDHQLSAAELSAAEEQLKQRDFNDDGVITAAELILDPKAIAAAADPAKADGELNSDDGPVLLIERATTRGQIADRLLKHYDRNRDGRLNTQAPEIEISLPAPLVGRLDANGDGALDREELGHFVDRRPDLELNFAMGRATAGDNRRQQRLATEEGFRVRKKLRDGYKLDLGDSEIDFNRNNRDPRQADLVEFRAFDRDNNGYIDASEAASNNIGKSAFAAMDDDGDGKVFKGEFSSFMARQNAAAAMRLQLEIKDSGQNLFKLLDVDGDGVLSPRELRQAANILSAADKNHDGSLGGDELPQSIEFILVRGVDENSEAETRSGYTAVRSAAKAGTTGPLWFRKMDRNNDGDLSLSEFVGPLEAFRKLDTNHDGFIDRAEAEAAK